MGEADAPTWATMPEVELLAAVVDQRPGAWTGFYRRYERLIAACVRKVLRRYTAMYIEADIEDVTNMVCLNLIKDDYKKLRAYDPERGCKLSSWVGLIATNTTLDTLRRKAPIHRSLDDTDGDKASKDVPDTAQTPAQALETREQWDQLRKAVMELNATDQKFLELYYDRQIEPDAIAKQMGISINTVYSRKNKVREKLKRIVASQIRQSA